MILARFALELPDFRGDVEVNESYFGGVRKSKRGPGAAGKVLVFGLLRRAGRVHVVMVADLRSVTSTSIIRTCVQQDSLVYVDSY